MTSALVVDDDAVLREVISIQLTSAGIETVTANNGRLALEEMCARTSAGKSFEVVILDLVMPEVDGWAVLKAIKNNPLWASAKVIVVSGHADSPSDLLRIIEFDGVYVEKRSGFVNTVKLVVERVLQE